MRCPQIRLLEVKACRSYDTFELIARTIPMPPFPFISTVVDPLVAARKQEQRCVAVVVSLSRRCCHEPVVAWCAQRWVSGTRHRRAV
jgi:hypothetical protein